MRIFLVIMLVIAAAGFIYLNERHLERRNLQDALRTGKKQQRQSSYKHAHRIAYKATGRAAPKKTDKDTTHFKTRKNERS